MIGKWPHPANKENPAYALKHGIHWMRAIVAPDARRNAMKNWMFSAALTLAFGTFAAGCAEDTAKPCSGSNCVSDAEIVANIKAEINRHDELTDWTIDVQSIKGVVYLHGMV